MAGFIVIANLVCPVVFGLVTLIFAYSPLGKWFERKCKLFLASLGLEIPKSPLPSDHEAFLMALQRYYNKYQSDKEKSDDIRRADDLKSYDMHCRNHEVTMQLLIELKSETVEHLRKIHDCQSGVAAALAAAIVPVIHDVSADGRENALDLARQVHEFIRELNRQLGRDLGAKVDLAVGRVLRALPQSPPRGEKTDSQDRHRRRNSA